MTWRIVVGTIIVFCCSYIGISFSKNAQKRVLQLKAFCEMLNILSFNVNFLTLPLKEAMLRTAESREKIVKNVLMAAVGILDSKADASAKEAWIEAIEQNKSGMALKPSDIEILKALGENFGKGNKEDCLNNINLTIAKLKIVEEEGEEEIKKEGKLWRGLGFLIGVFVVIILF